MRTAGQIVDDALASAAHGRDWLCVDDEEWIALAEWDPFSHKRFPMGELFGRIVHAAFVDHWCLLVSVETPDGADGHDYQVQLVPEIPVFGTE